MQNPHPDYSSREWVAGIVTTDLARITHVRRTAQSGSVTVNLPTAGTDDHVPFGQRLGSTQGLREQGKTAAKFYSIVKTSYILSGTHV